MNRYQKMNHLLFHRKAIGLALIVVLALLAARPIWRALAAAGDYDTTFSGDGKIDALLELSANGEQRMAIQHDGKILALTQQEPCSPSTDFRLVRLQLNGALDNTFSGDGIVTTDLGGCEAATNLAIHSSGKIVVVGTYRQSSQAVKRSAIVRYLPNGNLDTSFDGDGKLLGLNNTYLRSVAIQPDSKILVAGGCETVDDPYGEFIARYNWDGSLDTSFGFSGYVTNFEWSFIRKVALQSDGKILVSEGVMRRYLTSGQLDTAFGSNGTIYRPFVDILPLSDGKIVSLEHPTLTHGWIGRWLPSGHPDTTYTGTALNEYPYSHFSSLFLQEDGRLVAAGADQYPSDQSKGYLVRVNNNGGLDTSFGSGGYKTSVGSTLTDMALMADQRIAVTGKTVINSTPTFSVFARHKNDNTDTQTTDLSVGPITISPTTVNAGTIVAYTIPVKNNSTTRAAHVTLTMNVPSGTSYQKVVLPTGWAVMQEPSVGAMGTVTLASYQLAAGVTTKPRLEVRVNPTAGPAPTISMSATVSNTIADTNTSNNTGYKVFTAQ